MSRPKRKCTFTGCNGVHQAKGFCPGHYSQMASGKELRPLHRERVIERAEKRSLGNKVCCKCRVELPITEFGLCTASGDGFSYRCRPCNKITPEQRDRKLAAQRAAYQLDPTRVLIRVRALQYGIPDETVAQLIAGPCFICGLKERSLHIDHCHKTGAVRGALCLNCNTALGKFKDDSTMLRRAASYLESGRDFRPGTDNSGDSAVLPVVGASE